MSPYLQIIRRSLGRLFRRGQNALLFPWANVVRKGNRPSCSSGQIRVGEVALMKVQDGYSLKRHALRSEHPWIASLDETRKLPARGKTIHCAQTLQDIFAESKSSLPEFLGLIDAPDWLHHIPPSHDFFPWDNLELREIRRYSCGFRHHDRQNHQPTHHSWPGYGPQSLKACAKHAKRLLKLYRSLNRNGFRSNRRPDGVPEGVVLRDSCNNIRWITSGGNHRVTVAACLGFESVPIRVMSIVDVRDLADWPGVLTNLFTPSQARKVFEIFFAPAIPLLLTQA